MVSMQRNELEALRPAPNSTKRRGRPPIRTDAETRRLVIDVATRQFFARGFSVSTADIARSACVSKRAIYQLFPNKADLLAEIVQERREAMMADLDLEATDPSASAEILTRMLLAIARVLLSEENVSFNRLVTSQATAFPKLARAYYEEGPAKLFELVANVLGKLEQRGSIQLDDKPRAAASLINAVIAEPLRAGMLRARPPLTTEQIRRDVEAVVSIFLHGCGKGDSRPSSSGLEPMEGNPSCRKKPPDGRFSNGKVSLRSTRPDSHS